MPKNGRPKIGPRIALCVSDEQRGIWSEAAKCYGMTLSAWIRHVCDLSARLAANPPSESMCCGSHGAQFPLIGELPTPQESPNVGRPTISPQATLGGYNTGHLPPENDHPR